MKSTRFRRLTELFVLGKELLLPDGTYLWIQVINSYQRDECLHDAQVARARMTLALKGHGDERLKVEARFLEKGAEQMIDDLAQSQAAEKVSDFMDELRDEEEWKERMEVLLRTDAEEAARPLTPAETDLLITINSDVLAELRKREEDEAEFLRRKYRGMSDEDMLETYVDLWLEKRGGEIANDEFRLAEMAYAVRVCEAGPADADGTLDHSNCDGHELQVFTSKAEAREAPDALKLLIQRAIADLNIGGRDPKDSGRPPSSSDSQPTPSAGAESKPSS